MKVGAERREALREALERSGAERLESRGSGEEWRFALGAAKVTLWRTGTVKIQGKGEHVELLRRLVEEFALPDEIAARLPLDLPRDAPWAGVDESGKGDYFGPLVSAAVVLEPHAAAELAAAGVQDSKRITDGKIRKLAPHVERVSRHALTVLEPARYNALYAEAREQGMRLNQLLAYAHVRSLTALLHSGAQPAYAIVDQFADERVVRRAAEGHTGDLRILQFPRAEADVAVAAASVLARKGFLDWMEHASTEIGVTLPRGASDLVVAAARELVAQHGEDVLGRVAKLHFATTGKVLP